MSTVERRQVKTVLQMTDPDGFYKIKNNTVIFIVIFSLTAPSVQSQFVKHCCGVPVRKAYHFLSFISQSLVIHREM